MGNEEKFKKDSKANLWSTKVASVALGKESAVQFKLNLKVDYEA